MDTKENQNEENNVDIATDDHQPPTNNNTNTSSGLQQIEDDNSDLPLPMGHMAEVSNAAELPEQRKVEQIKDDDLGPEPPAAMLEASLNATDPELNSKTSAAISNNLASVNETSPPTPFNSANYEDTIAKKKDAMNQKPAAVSSCEGEKAVLSPPDRDSIYAPSREDIESMDEIRGNTNTNTGRGDTNRRGDDIGSGSNNNESNDTNLESRVARGIESQTRNDTAGNINNDQEDIHIPVAWKVDDDNDEDGNRSEGEVYIATPTLPWWKQRRAKIFFGLVIVLVGALAVALGVSLSQPNNLESESTNSTIIFVTPPPTPPITYECFGADEGGENGILYNAVRAYVSQDCANNQECPVAKIYSWPMNSWCVGSVKDMSYLFYEMGTYNEDISDWNTSSATNMESMFSWATAFNGDLSNFDTASVTDMGSMFYGATSFNRDLSNFNTSSVTAMSWMFSTQRNMSGNSAFTVF